jgi:type IV fimbrial biogenesis protein FimT
LIITLAISAILIGLAVPSLQSFMGDSEISATSNDFVYSLQTARSEAIKRAGPVGLCPSSAPLADEPVCSGADYARGWIVFFDSNGNGSRDAADEVVQQAEARSPAFTFTADNVFSQRIYFGESGTSINPAGVPLSGNIDISYAGGDTEKRTVRVAANGRITTVNPATTVTP